MKKIGLISLIATFGVAIVFAFTTPVQAQRPHPGPGYQQPGHPNHPGQPVPPGHPNHPGQPVPPGHPNHPGQPVPPGHPNHPGQPVPPGPPVPPPQPAPTWGGVVGGIIDAIIIESHRP